MKSNAAQVLVVDDSAVVRGLLRRALESDPGIVVAGTAMHGERALAWLRENHADVVILDVEMPVMDGLTALRHIQSEFPQTPVVMASSLTYGGAETTVKALALGAAGCIAKPTAGSTAESISQLVNELVPLVKALARPTTSVVSTPNSLSCSKSTHFPPRAIVIGSSTGGPRALSETLTDLPADFSVPILIVQHMPPMFTPLLAKHIAQDTSRPCREAVDGVRIEPGHTYIAPGDFHLTVEAKADHFVARLNQNEPEHFCRPSVNPLFHTASRCYGSTLLGVMLTGMGDDGIEGTRALVAAGGYMIAQDEASSVVWGMPAAVCREDLAHEILPLNKIGQRIGQLCNQEICQI